MTDPSLDIGRATEADVAGILELQAANQQACGGMLSAELPRGRVEAMMRSMPLIVARRSGRVVGFLMATTQDMNSGLAVVRAMFDAYPSSPESYVYGPHLRRSVRAGPRSGGGDVCRCIGAGSRRRSVHSQRQRSIAARAPENGDERGGAF